MGSTEFRSKSQKKTLCVVLGDDWVAFAEREAKSFEFNDSTSNVVKCWMQSKLIA